MAIEKNADVIHFGFDFTFQILKIHLSFIYSVWWKHTVAFIVKEINQKCIYKRSNFTPC